MAGSTGSATNKDYLYVSSKKKTVKTQNTKFMAFPWSHMWSPVCCLNTFCWFAWKRLLRNHYSFLYLCPISVGQIPFLRLKSVLLQFKSSLSNSYQKIQKKNVSSDHKSPSCYLLRRNFPHVPWKSPLKPPRARGRQSLPQRGHQLIDGQTTGI
jgi:hypothetical protein